jgi:hypothetical protein
MPTGLLVIDNIPEKFDRLYAARDRERPAIKYDVNIARLSCTCLDFTEKRLSFPPGDVRRVCAHLYDKLYQTKAERAFDPLVQLFIRYGREMLTYRTVSDALGRFFIGFPFGPRHLRAIAVVDGEPLLATYDLGQRDWEQAETPLTPTRAAEVLERMRRAYPEAFGHGGTA